MKHSLIEVGAHIEAAAAGLRTLESMLADERSKVAPSSDAYAQARQKSFLPTMPIDQYVDLKTGLHAEGPAVRKPQDGQAAAPARTCLVEAGPNLPGARDTGRLVSSDTHGAIGRDQFVEVTNAHIEVVDRHQPARRTGMPLAAFFGYSARVLFDPRVVYDALWQRWIVTAAAFQESNTRQLFFIAVSTSANALGPYFVYSLNVGFAPGDFWDYPQLGHDQDAVIVTANVFAGRSGFRGAAMFAVAKARLYNGLGFSVPVFTGLRGTLAPPIVLDQNARTYLIAAAGGNALSLYTLTNSGRPNAIGLSGPVNIVVPAYTAPPPARQPGTGAVLDTLDGRFVNASTQTGDFLWQVHTINLAGYAAPRFYQIDTVTHSVVRSAFFFGTSTSYDFNASIAANASNDVFVTWTLTDPARGTHTQLRCSGFDHDQGANYVLGPGTAAFTSQAPYADFRWGDYSAVSIDPLDARRAWLVNQTTLAERAWGSRIVGIGFRP